jgi:hypothetical protein
LEAARIGAERAYSVEWLPIECHVTANDRTEGVGGERLARHPNAGEPLNAKEPLLRREGEKVRIQCIDVITKSADPLRTVEGRGDSYGARRSEQWRNWQNSPADP